MQCIVYIDLNMVCAGVVKHPAEWSYSGYGEIQGPRRKNILINYERLRELLGYDTYAGVKTVHRRWVESYLGDGRNSRDDKWSGSIAVGDECFIRNIKAMMGGMATGRKCLESGESYQLRETQSPYTDHLGAKKTEIDPLNAYVWE